MLKSFSQAISRITNDFAPAVAPNAYNLIALFIMLIRIMCIGFRIDRFEDVPRHTSIKKKKLGRRKMIQARNWTLREIINATF